MSGDLRLANSGVAPLVTSLAALAEAVPIGEFAVIGGLAVLARLQGAHRVTYDLDTVATQDGDELTAVETAVSADGVDGLLLGTKDRLHCRWRRSGERHLSGPAARCGGRPGLHLGPSLDPLTIPPLAGHLK